MELCSVTPETVPAFTRACAHEHVFGSKALTALRAHGLESAAHRYFHRGDAAALYLTQGVLVISAAGDFNPAPIAAFSHREQVHEIDLALPHAQALRRMLGGKLESSFFMVYTGPPQPPACPGLHPGDLSAVFDILQQSHEYYRTHLDFSAWSADLDRKLSLGLMELWQLDVDGMPAATGSIISEDDTCAVIGAVAVVPAYRRRGYATALSRALVHRIQQRGKTPRLISGYDAVAALYRQIGFTPCGRWGELYL